MNPTAKCPPADNERRTPDWIISAAHFVLGDIDLDPASDNDGNIRVAAAEYFDIVDDGLNQLWYGRVFLNPPGGKLDPTTLKPTKGCKGALSSAAVWWSKLLNEIAEGRTEEAIFVCFNLEAMLNTQKLAPLPIQEFTFCVPSKRVEYPSVNGGNTSSPAGASAIVYIGDNQTRFNDAFSPHGYVRFGTSKYSFLEYVKEHHAPISD